MITFLISISPLAFAISTFLYVRTTLFGLFICHYFFCRFSSLYYIFSLKYILEVLFTPRKYRIFRHFSTNRRGFSQPFIYISKGTVKRYLKMPMKYNLSQNKAPDIKAAHLTSAPSGFLFYCNGIPLLFPPVFSSLYYQIRYYPKRIPYHLHSGYNSYFFK